MENKPVYIYVSNKKAPNDIIVHQCDKVDNKPGMIVTDLLENDTVCANWLPFVVTSYDMIKGMNIIEMTESEEEFLSLISQSQGSII